MYRWRIENGKGNIKTKVKEYKQWKRKKKEKKRKSKREKRSQWREEEETVNKVESESP